MVQSKVWELWWADETDDQRVARIAQHDWRKGMDINDIIRFSITSARLHQRNLNIVLFLILVLLLCLLGVVLQ